MLLSYGHPSGNMSKKPEVFNMSEAKIIAIGDNVVDKYLSRGKMYPGGQCVNTCVYSIMNGGKPAYLGKFGDDGVAEYS